GDHVVGGVVDVGAARGVGVADRQWITGGCGPVVVPVPTVGGLERVAARGERTLVRGRVRRRVDQRGRAGGAARPGGAGAVRVEGETHRSGRRDRADLARPGRGGVHGVPERRRGGHVSG